MGPPMRIEHSLLLYRIIVVVVQVVLLLSRSCCCCPGRNAVLRVSEQMLRLLKNLSGSDISQPDSRVLSRRGSSQDSIH